MNGLLIAAGILGFVGFFAHVYLGERFILRSLRPETLPNSFLGDGDTTKRYLRWFWHVGSFDIGASSLALVVIGAMEPSPYVELVARGLAVHFFGIFAVFLGVAATRPRLFLRIPQGSAIGLGGLFLWFAATGG